MAEIEPIAPDRRRREGAEYMLAIIDEAVVAAIDREDVDPEVLIDRVARLARWTASRTADVLVLPSVCH